MSKFFEIVLCVAMISVFAEEVYGLTCLSCQSTDVNSRCRYGQRSKTTKKQMCHGPTAKCLAIATVNEYGYSHFQRGCTLEDICAEMNDSDIEFCSTCASKHCNYNVMELDEEVEKYLNEVREYEIYTLELSQNATKQATATVSSVAAKSKTNKHHTVSGTGSTGNPTSNSYQHNNSETSQDNAPLSPNQIIVGNSDEEGVPITSADESYGNPNFELHEETSKSDESPKRSSDGGKSGSEGYRSNDYVEFGTKLLK